MCLIWITLKQNACIVATNNKIYFLSMIIDVLNLTPDTFAFLYKFIKYHLGVKYFSDEDAVHLHANQRKWTRIKRFLRWFYTCKI